MKKIALDAGHGLLTAGKQTPNGIKEWTLNDKVRDEAVRILSEYDVEIMHLDNDEGWTDESLASRLAAYKKAGVDAMVSIHHNAYTSSWNEATGIEVFVDRNCTDADMELAKAVHSRMVKYISLRDRGIKKANFHVINQNTIPAVLCEGGFMDSTIDYDFITSEAGQKAYGRAVAEGLIDFLDLKKKTVSKPAEPTAPVAPKPVTNKISKGSVVTIAKGATWYNGKKVPSWVIAKKWIVSSVSGDRAVVDKSSDGKNSVCSPINVKFLTCVNASTKTEPADTSFKVQVKISNLNIRKGPGTNYARVGKYTGIGVFTISETKSGAGSKSGWGKLKSGEGWISLDYAKRV